MKSVEEQLAVIHRGTDQIVPLDELRRKLQRGQPLRVKYGIDPTGIDVHLGHTVPLRKLKQFQDLGHQAVLIIGNYTALVGDPSGRDQTRARLTREQVEQNAKDYLIQISKIIDITKTEVRPNGEWFGKYDFTDVLKLTSQTTVQRMLERDDFTKRFRSEPSVPIYLHECLYPLMQGWDSVEIRADVELGGSEQLFNLMMARHLQANAGQEPQVCVTLPILRGLDGVRRMGKSLGNYVGVGMTAQEQFDKTMSLPDEPMREWFTLLTDREPADIDALLAGHPIDAKKALGRDVVACYHGGDAAAAAQAEWEKRFSRREDPTDIPEVVIAASELANGEMNISKLLTLLGLTKSNSEAKQKVSEGAVSVGADKAKISDPKANVAVADGLIVRLGSKKIVRVRVGN